MTVGERIHRLWRGLLSVLYYYLSCSPWHLYKRNRRQKKQDRLDREHTLDNVTPGQYQQPASFGTNPYWTQEIVLGPGPPVRHQTKRQKRLLERLRNTDLLARGRDTGTTLDHDNDSSAHVDGQEGRNTATSSVPEYERWRLHQRQDEPLWGSDAHLASLAPPDRSSTVSSRLLELANEVQSKPSWFVARNPPVNDMSPPIVSNPAQSETSNMWMLQPPPAAEVMSGHIDLRGTSNRSRSTTDSSVSSRRTNQVPLSRELSKRIIGEKLNRSGLLFPRENGTFPSSNLRHPLLQAGSGIEASYDLDDDGNKAKRRQTSGHTSTSSTDTTIHRQSPTPVAVSSRAKTENNVPVTTSLAAPDAEVLRVLRKDFALDRRASAIASSPDKRPSTASKLLQLASELTGEPESSLESPILTDLDPDHISKRPHYIRRWTVDF